MRDYVSTIFLNKVKIWSICIAYLRYFSQLAKNKFVFVTEIYKYHILYFCA